MSQNRLNRTRACTGPTRPYFSALTRASPGWATNFDAIFGEVPDSQARLGRSLVPQCLALSPRVAAALEEPQDVSSALLSLGPLDGLTLRFAGGGGGAIPQPPGLSVAIWHAYVLSALFLTGTLGSSSFVVLEALQIFVSDVISYLGDDCVTDYLITQLAMVLQQGLQLR